MGRDRYQEGSLVLVGKRVKKWRGHFYVYEKQTDGSEKRRFRNIPLGLKAEMDKGKARAKLREAIAAATKNLAPAPACVTLRWFYENRFLPQKEQQWKVTSRPKTKRFIENYLLKRFGDTLLPDFDKFTLQTYINELALKFSKSVITKIRVYLNSILDEAVELEMLVKNPAGRLSVPKFARRAATKALTPQQIPLILFHLSERNRLIVRMFLVLGLRPGEMFALRWNDKDGNSLRIDSSISDGIEVETKTEGSDAAVWLPASIETELEFWREKTPKAAPDEFIFPTTRGTAISTNNFLYRVLKEAGKRAGIPGVNHQMLRRTCSTYMAQLTTVRDVQAHLRHTSAKTTLEHYIKSVPASVRVAVESLDCMLKSIPSGEDSVPS
ncbi:MAG TPA: site-specific integrase [Bryobacteraceae bacterium]|nr:site-specific integrase [Bryobacteraceae bacterium]